MYRANRAQVTQDTEESIKLDEKSEVSLESSFDDFESNKLCPLQLFCGRKRWFLRARASKYCENDEKLKTCEP